MQTKNSHSLYKKKTSRIYWKQITKSYIEIFQSANIVTFVELCHNFPLTQFDCLRYIRLAMPTGAICLTTMEICVRWVVAPCWYTMVLERTGTLVNHRFFSEPTLLVRDEIYRWCYRNTWDKCNMLVWHRVQYLLLCLHCVLRNLRKSLDGFKSSGQHLNLSIKNPLWFTSN